MKLIGGLWAWCWWWSQSYLSGEMRVDEAATPNGRWIPALRVSVLPHDACRGIIVIYAEAFGWESLSGSLSLSYMVQAGSTWRLGSLGGEVF